MRCHNCEQPTPNTGDQSSGVILCDACKENPRSTRDATIISRDGDHEFVDPAEWGSNIPGVFCRKCLLMRRADGTCDPCKGKARLRL